MKKLLIIMLAMVLVFAAGCGKKDETTDDTANQQTQQTQQQDAENEQQGDEHNDKKDVSEIDVSDVTGEELDSLVETFNSETASEEEKEEARLKLEAIFKQAEANQQ